MWRANLFRACYGANTSLRKASSWSPFPSSGFPAAPLEMTVQSIISTLRTKPIARAWLGQRECSFASGAVAPWRHTGMYTTETLRENISEWARLVHQQALSSSYLWPVSYSKWVGQELHPFASMIHPGFHLAC